MKEIIKARNGLYIFTLLAIFFVLGVILIISVLSAGTGTDMSGMLMPIIPIIIMFAFFSNLVIRQ